MPLKTLKTYCPTKTKPRVTFKGGRNRYDLISKPGWKGSIVKIDPLDKCALVVFDEGYISQWIFLDLLEITEGREEVEKWARQNGWLNLT